MFDLLLIYGLRCERNFVIPGHKNAINVDVSLWADEGSQIRQKRETTVIPRLSLCHPVKVDVKLKGFVRDWELRCPDGLAACIKKLSTIYG